MTWTKTIADLYSFWSELVPGLLSNMAVVILCAYIFSHKNADILFGGTSRRKKHNILLIAIGSSLGIFGTINSIPILDVQSNIRNVGPIIAGMLGGPIVGGISGLIAGIHRYFMGGNTACPCAIAAIFAGVFSGVLYNLNKKHFIGVKFAILSTIFIEIIHSSLILLMQQPIEVAIKSQSITLPARIITESLGIGLFSFIITDIIKSLKIRDEKQKFEKELAIGREIQMSILPKIFPPQPGWQAVEIYGVVQPAREVAGDFFDFFKINERLVCFTIGDVSDKGVPASLYMAVTKTLLKAKCETADTPSTLLQKVNKELCDGNDSLMYVTLFCGFLDTETGMLTYCNAGHPPPFLLKDGKAIEISEKGGMALGVMEYASYSSLSMQLSENDCLFLYTDGLTDAQNKRRQTIDENKIIELLNNNECHGSAKQMIQFVFDAVNRFQNVENQFDDITLLSLRWKNAVDTSVTSGDNQVLQHS
jgi:sigma-B regulation protein RsbU (phosphoserine phosphatase)